MNRKNIQLAKELLEKGKVIAFPTETVYGLGASIFDDNALKEIFELKGRPLDNPLIVHIHSLEQVKLLARNIPEDFYLLAKHFMPGPLTVILSKNKEISPTVTANRDTIAVRMPSHSLALELLKEVDVPLAAPSANLSGKPSPTCFDHVVEDFKDKLPLILDGGPCDVGIESTVISLVGEPTVLRPGSISKENLEEVLQKPVKTLTKSNEALCPGMKYRHYTPNAKVVVFESMNALKEKLDSSKDKKIRILSNKREIDNSYPFNSKSLYKLFRDADRDAVDLIYLWLDEETKGNTALLNRISKASG